MSATRDVAGCRFVTAEYGGTATADGGVTLIAATAASLAGPAGRDRRLAGRWPRRPRTAAWSPTCTSPAEGEPDADALAARLGELLAAAAPGCPGRLARITVTVAGASGAAMQHHFTFRPDGAGFAEDRLIRGLHPQVAERLQLDRLREFDLTRLPSADEEIYLFKAVAKSNPADERLIAMGQVRDLTPLREADGRLVALPELENVLAGCLDAIRIVQAQRPQHKRFDTNRIMIYVWPASDFTAEELDSLAHRIRPTTSGAGLEEVQFVARQRAPSGELTEVAVRVTADAGGRVQLHIGPPPTEPIPPLDDYRQKVLRAARRGNVYPYELTGLLAGPRTAGSPSTTWTRSGAAGAGGPAEGQEHRGHRRRAWSARRPGGTPRASPGWCCSATRPSRSARCPSRSARG